MGYDVPTAAGGIAQWQAGVISRPQLLDAGLSSQLVKRRLERGRWQLTHPDEERWRDSQRDNKAGAQGVQTYRYSWRDVYGNPCETALLQAQILRQHGWRGNPRPCSARCPVAHGWLAPGAA
jgi:hypothetical protein